MTDLSRIVSMNRSRLRGMSSTFVDVDARNNYDLTFSRNTLTVSVEARLYTRPLRHAGISGHQSASKYGSGVGQSGDVRGAWVHQSTVQESLTYSGRTAFRDALYGDEGRFEELAIGTGTSTSTLSDTSLEIPRGTPRHDWSLTPSASTIQRTGIIPFHKHESLAEVGVRTSDATPSLLTRAVDETFATTPDDEVRLDIEFQVTPSTIGTSAIQQGLLDALFGRLRDTPGSGLTDVAVGTGTNSPTSNDTALQTEVHRNPSGRAKGESTYIASGLIPAPKPSTQPHDLSEVGWFSHTGSLAFRATFDACTKDSDTTILLSAAFKIR